MAFPASFHTEFACEKLAGKIADGNHVTMGPCSCSCDHNCNYGYGDAAVAGIWGNQLYIHFFNTPLTLNVCYKKNGSKPRNTCTIYIVIARPRNSFFTWKMSDTIGVYCILYRKDGTFSFPEETHSPGLIIRDSFSDYWKKKRLHGRNSNYCKGSWAI